MRKAYKKLTQLPYLPRFTTILLLDGNNLTHIPTNAFQNIGKCRSLSLRKNPISRLECGTFKGLKELRYLYLSKMKLSQIESCIFEDQEKLTKLDLGHNNIITIKEGTFKHLVNLKMLYFSHNEISTFAKDLFNGQGHLKTLLLSTNQIMTVFAKQFYQMKELMILDLSQNCLKMIKLDSFVGLNNLERLNLTQNCLETIKLRIFDPLKNLQDLYLSNNPIKKIPVGIFQFQTNLKHLFLSGLEIKRFPHGIFHNLRSLQKMQTDAGAAQFDPYIWPTGTRTPTTVISDVRSISCEPQMCWLKHEETAGRFLSSSQRKLKCKDGNLYWHRFDCSAIKSTNLGFMLKFFFNFCNFGLIPTGRRCYFFAGICGAPHYVPFASAPRIRWPYMVGSQLNYTCEDGYKGGGSSICTAHGNWTGVDRCTGRIYKSPQPQT